MKFRTIIFFESDVRKFKKELLQGLRWEKLKKYAEENGVSIPIEPPPIAAAEYDYATKCIELEKILRDNIQHSRILRPIGTENRFKALAYDFSRFLR